MKCDELEEEYLWTNNVKTPSTIMVRAYNADEVDKVLAKKDFEILNLKAENSYIKADSAFDRDKHEELLSSTKTSFQHRNEEANK